MKEYVIEISPQTPELFEVWELSTGQCIYLTDSLFDAAQYVEKKQLYMLEHEYD